MGDCDSIYIGQTGRNLKTRVNEHLNNHEKSPFGSHLHHTKHKFSTDNVRLLHMAERGRKLTALENLEIIKAKNTSNVRVLNEEIPSSTLADYYYNRIISTSSL